MSVYLEIYPLRGPRELGETMASARNCLVFGQDYRVYGQLMDMADRHDADPEIPEKPSIETHPLPPQLHVLLTNQVKTCRKDSYDEVLTFSYAKDMKKIRLPRGCDFESRAVMAYIRQLPDDVPIVLYWR